MSKPVPMFDMEELQVTPVDVALLERAGLIPVPVFNVELKKRGGLWFLRLGDFRFSFCRVRR